MHRRCVPCLDRQRMRIKIVFLTTLALVSCGDLVRFEEPQPAGQSNEKGIPERLVGQYLSSDDSARLVIASGLIIKYSVSVFSDMIDSVDRKDIKGDTTYSGTEDKLKFDIVVKGDSAFQRWSYYDTLFDVKRGDILRKYKGHYFLNQQVSTNSWRVTTLAKIGNGLSLGTISTKDDLSNLRTVTETKSDTIFSFRPTKKEMKKFLKDKGFSHQDTFIKVEQ
jgi:hypothetical protein